MATVVWAYPGLASATTAGGPAELAELTSAGTPALNDQTPPASPQLYDDAVLEDDPLLYYRFDDTGQIVADQSGNGRNGVYAASAIRTETGPLAGDGSLAVGVATSGSPPVSMSDAGLPSGAAPRTVEVWARSSVNDRLFVRYGDFGIKLQSSTILRVVLDADSAVNFTLPDAATTTRWHHYVVTFDAAGTVVAYRDGQRLGSTPASGVASVLSGTAYVGFGAGAYDEVAIFDEALNAERVREHWLRGASVSDDELCPTSGTLEPSDAYGAVDPVWWTRGFGGQAAPRAASASAGVRWSRAAWCRWRL